MATKPFEKLGSFYLGREHDLASGETADTPVLYDAKDLTTHAFCVGMTGSGKTGLCVGLLEEAALDGVPAIVIDPKGDLGNLLLTFPDLAPGDFEPWVDPDQARRKNIDVPTLAAQQADLWKGGLASWGQDGERIARLKAAADFDIYTPGSEAGRQVSMLKSFDAPPPSVVADGDLLRDRIAGTVTGLLGLLGIDADPIRSREHILLSTILDASWRTGTSLDLAGLIRAIQQPPFDRIGVMELDSFFPDDDRFALAMQLNNLLAAPGFQSWMQGEPLDVGKLLYTNGGKPRVSIFSIAHLGEAERMFFVSLLLNEILAWTRTRPGTSSLRAIVYMDEIAGYLPPVANPPSKKPLLTMLKQARAFGVGVVLATQNPVDLDYKGLSNTGTWFLGRLQTERDKQRVLEGLEGAGAGSGGFDRAEMEKTLAGLGKRVFLLHNVHEPAPVVFHTRWVMSYLRGPLTRSQIRDLMAERQAEAGVATPVAAVTSAPSAAPPVAATAPPAPAPASTVAGAGPRPMLRSTVPQAFVARRTAAEQAVWSPWLVGLGRVQFVDSKTKQTLLTRDVSRIHPLREDIDAIDWEAARAVELDREDLEPSPDEELPFRPLAEDASSARSYRSWKKQLSDHVYRNETLELWRSPSLALTSQPGEDEATFRGRLAELAREKRDHDVEELREKFARRQAKLEERQRRAEQKLDQQKEQVSSQGLQAAISVGAAVLSSFLGRKRFSARSVGKATTALRGGARVARERGDVARAEEDLAAIQAQMRELEDELQAEIEELEERYDPAREELEQVALRPRRADVDIRHVGLAWLPEDGTGEPLWR